ncbi:MAG TPA: hypothetical protein VMT32_18745 [Bryobacteraceae bacterium]|nr:hypothetical protein [Bryobacteraceae bacterium]
MRIVLALVPVAIAAAQGPDAREIVRRSLEASEQNWRIARNYTFLQRTEEHRMDAGGGVKSKEVKTYDITLLQGSPYIRLVARDDHPLPPAEEKKEQDKLQKSIADRMKESPAQRERRISEYDKRRKRQQDEMREVGDAFDFRILGTDRVDGHDVWVLQATPRRGYEPRSRDAKILPHVRGKLWIDQKSFHWAKLEAEVISPVSWGLFLVRLDSGARLYFDMTRVNDEVWLPQRIWISASARLGLFKKLRVEEDTTYKNYRKFQTDSRMVASQ